MITASHLHAMVIHFPIALLMIGFLSEIIALFNKKPFYVNVSLFLLVLGTIGAIISYASGSYAADGMTEGDFQKPIGMHEEAAFVTLILAIVTSLLKGAIYFFDYQKNWSNWTSLVLYIILIGSLGRTAYLGRELVFKHGAGIELVLPDFEDSKTD